MALFIENWDSIRTQRRTKKPRSKEQFLIFTFQQVFVFRVLLILIRKFFFKTFGMKKLSSLTKCFCIVQFLTLPPPPFVMNTHKYYIRETWHLTQVEKTEIQCVFCKIDSDRLTDILEILILIFTLDKFLAR